jgi:hypothetical protein
VEENKEQAPRQLSLMETFKLYLWTLWKAGAYTDAQVANILGFMDRLSPKETMDFCMDQLVQVTLENKEIYDGVRRGSSFVVDGVAGGEVEATNTTGNSQSVASTPTPGN